MIATHASTPTNATRYAAATYFSPALTAATSDVRRIDWSVQTDTRAKPARPEAGIASDASRQKFPQLAQALVQPLPRQLDAVHRRREREQPGPRDTEGQEHRARHLRPVAREHGRVDEVVREADREPADGDQDDAEERVDRAHVRARRPRVDRVAEHEVRRVEEEQDQERHELVRAPRPPDAPRGASPDRARDEG